MGAETILLTGLFLVLPALLRAAEPTLDGEGWI